MQSLTNRSKFIFLCIFIDYKVQFFCKSNFKFLVYLLFNFLTSLFHLSIQILKNNVSRFFNCLFNNVMNYIRKITFLKVADIFDCMPVFASLLSVCCNFAQLLIIISMIYSILIRTMDNFSIFINNAGINKIFFTTVYTHVFDFF